MIISFAWTTPAFLARRKTRTRREWSDDYAKRFHVGDIVQAWDHVPRVKGAKKIGELKITGLKKESISLMPDGDFEKEGFAYLAENSYSFLDQEPHDYFDKWKSAGGDYWVIDFVRVG